MIINVGTVGIGVIGFGIGVGVGIGVRIGVGIGVRIGIGFGIGFNISLSFSFSNSISLNAYVRSLLPSRPGPSCRQGASRTLSWTVKVRNGSQTNTTNKTDQTSGITPINRYEYSWRCGLQLGYPANSLLVGWTSGLAGWLAGCPPCHPSCGTSVIEEEMSYGHKVSKEPVIFAKPKLCCGLPGEGASRLRLEPSPSTCACERACARQGAGQSSNSVVPLSVEPGMHESRPAMFLR